MLFNSLHFMFFFPIVSIIYFIIPTKKRWIWLLITSYYFYMSWNPKYAILIATSTIITYLSGILIEKTNNQSNLEKRIDKKKLYVFLSFTLNLGILFFYKYFDFFINNINLILENINLNIINNEFDIILPVGISFYTFQALSYTMDVYRGEIYAEKNIFKYALFVSFFPQLVAGPIERSKNLLIQINEEHKFSYNNLKNGLILMSWGMFQKLVIADRIAILVNEVFNNYTNYEGFEITVAVVLFAIQIYCDFSSYTDLARGAAEVLGFKLMSNFERPYFSKTIAEFWRRWHISLSSWFKDYLYIPLGGSRCSRFNKYRNILIVFLVSGLWHGASWNYIVWGGLHGFYQIFSDMTQNIRKRINKFLKVDTKSFSYKLIRVISTFILVDFAWIFFRSNSITVSIIMIIKMTKIFNPWIFFDGTLFEFGLDCKDFTIMMIAIGVLFVVSLIKRKISIRQSLAQQNLVFRWTIYYLLIFSIIIFGIYGFGYDSSQFIYFQF